MSSEERSAGYKRRRFTIACVVIAVSLIAGHRLILRGVYGFLVSEDATQQVDYAVVMSADRALLDKVADVLQQHHASRVLIVQRRLPRVAQLGIAPAPSDRIRRQLIDRGVEPSMIELFETDSVTNWEVTRELDQYLAGNATSSLVAIVSAQHQTRYLRWVLNHAIDPARTDRYRMWSYQVTGVDPDSWWSSRKALVKVAVTYLRFVHAIGFGEGDFERDNWSPEAYEESIRPAAMAAAA